MCVYVHCPQSNSSQTVGYFDPKVVSAQIQSLAIFETVDYVQGGKPHPFHYDHINHTPSQLGYTHILTHDSFVRRYKRVCSDVIGPTPKGTPEVVKVTFVPKLAHMTTRMTTPTVNRTCSEALLQCVGRRMRIVHMPLGRPRCS